jgi:hypothetical protein
MRPNKRPSLNPHNRPKKRVVEPTRTLMGQRSPAEPDPTPQGFVFKPGDCLRSTAEGLHLEAEADTTQGAREMKPRFPELLEN